LAGPLRTIGEASRTGAIQLGVFASVASSFAAKMAWDYNKTLDQQRVAFTTFMGSAEKAERFIKRLQDLALKSPVLDPKSTGEAARTLMAYGIAHKDILPWVKALGD